MQTRQGTRSRLRMIELASKAVLVTGALVVAAITIPGPFSTMPMELSRPAAGTGQQG
ncbi:MAG: hypothetical protein ACRDV9_12555 [Acidimicrobiia bacterium]